VSVVSVLVHLAKPGKPNSAIFDLGMAARSGGAGPVAGYQPTFTQKMQRQARRVLRTRR
jgi:hypothetical protein